MTRWAATIALVVAAGLGGDALGVPSPALLGGLVVGVVIALRTSWELVAPSPARAAAQALVGVVLGAYLQSSTLGEVGKHIAPVLVVSVATLALTILAGVVMARFTVLDKPTASFGMIAGGASGIVAIADELGADNRLVAVMQYLRVVVILVLSPLVASVVYGASGGGGGGSAGGEATLGALDAVLYAAVSIGAGLLLARVTKLPAGSLLGPMIVAGALQLAGVGFAGPLPTVVQSISIGVIGTDVGLRFTPASLKSAAHVLAPTLASIVVLLVLCAGLGAALAALTGQSGLSGYLATTPGGLYAVLATAITGGADTTFVLAVQVLRVFVMLLAAPLVARRLATR